MGTHTHTMCRGPRGRFCTVPIITVFMPIITVFMPIITVFMQGTSPENRPPKPPTCRIVHDQFKNNPWSISRGYTVQNSGPWGWGWD